MKLGYANGPLTSALVMQRDAHRVELHILEVGETWLLVGLSGDPADLPDITKCQGPYQSADQASAAMRAIIAALAGYGYLRAPDSPVWAFRAAALGRKIERERSLNAVNTRFDPDTDIY